MQSIVGRPVAAGIRRPLTEVMKAVSSTARPTSGKGFLTGRCEGEPEINYENIRVFGEGSGSRAERGITQKRVSRIFLLPQEAGSPAVFPLLSFRSRKSRLTMPLNLTLDFTQYRNALPLGQVMNALGLSVNGDSMILCPAHSEKHPSCKIYPDHVHCFSCGFHEDSIGLVQHVLKYEFWGSREWIADRAGI